MGKTTLSTWLVAVVFTTSAVAADFAIRDNDRVVFLGDSITEQRLYTTYVEAYALTRHPDWNLTFRNVGWGGDTAWLRQRAHPDEAKLFAAPEAEQQKMVDDAVGRGLARDVIPLHPTFITIKFGMNDHSYQAFRPDIYGAYIRSQNQLGKVLKENGARVAYLTPQPIEEKRKDPELDVRNLSLRRFGEGLKEVAAKHDALFVNQFDPYMGIMLAARVTDGQATIGRGDAVHPGPPGQTLMAWAVLKGLGATPNVSSVIIDAPNTTSTTSHCTVQNLTVKDGLISFDRLDKALPFPVDDRAEGVLRLAPVLQDLSRYTLEVTGLPEGLYQVVIDGEAVKKAEPATLEKGINLTTIGGPITKQAREVLSLVFQKNNIFFHRWRDVQLYNFPGWAQSAEVETKRTEEIKKLDKEIAGLEEKINAARKPKSHHFEIKRLTK